MTAYELYNFDQKPLGKDVEANLIALYQHFCTLLQPALTQKLRHPATVELVNSGTAPSSELRLMASCEQLMTCKASGPLSMVIGFNCGLLQQFVTCAGGGKPTEKSFSDAPLSSIDQKMIRPILTLITDLLSQAWRPVINVSFTPTSMCTADEFRSHESPDQYVAHEFALQVGPFSGSFSIWTAQHHLAPLRQKITALGHKVISNESASNWKREISTQLLDAPITLRAILGEATVTVSELLKMKTGDLIMLDQKTSDPLRVLIENLEKFRATFHTTPGGYQALKIVK